MAKFSTGLPISSIYDKVMHLNITNANSLIPLYSTMYLYNGNGVRSSYGITFLPKNNFNHHFNSLNITGNFIFASDTATCKADNIDVSNTITCNLVQCNSAIVTGESTANNYFIPYSNVDAYCETLYKSITNNNTKVLPKISTQCGEGSVSHIIDSSDVYKMTINNVVTACTCETKWSNGDGNSDCVLIVANGNIFLGDRRWYSANGYNSTTNVKLILKAIKEDGKEDIIKEDIITFKGTRYWTTGNTSPSSYLRFLKGYRNFTYTQLYNKSFNSLKLEISIEEFNNKMRDGVTPYNCTLNGCQIMWMSMNKLVEVKIGEPTTNE